MLQVVACVDGSRAAPAVCDYAAWASRHVGAPLLLLHVLDEARYPVEPDLAGSIGLGSREQLLHELAELDRRRASWPWNTATICWKKPNAGYVPPGWRR